MTDPRLRIPLSKLWSDIRVPGLPVVMVVNGELCGVGIVEFGGRVAWDWLDMELDTDGADKCSLDLSRPGASDILARRVAAAVGAEPIEAQWSAQRALYSDEEHHGWMCRGAKVFTPVPFGGWFVVPGLADLDPSDDTRLIWGKDGCLGTPRVVNLVALGIVGPHLFEQEQRNA